MYENTDTGLPEFRLRFIFSVSVIPQSWWIMGEQTVLAIELHTKSNPAMPGFWSGNTFGDQIGAWSNLNPLIRVHLLRQRWKLLMEFGCS